MNTNEPLISVITTVYNTEKYLDRCFLSVLNQTYKNLEFIVVDNGSQGNIQEIVKDYRTVFPQRKILLVTLKENIGLFRGRLEGIKNANGDYISFIDSDDRVSIDYYRVLIEKAQETNADMVASDVIFEFSDNSMLYENLNPYHLHDLDIESEDIRELYWKQEGLCYYWHLVWNKIYSKSLIEQSLPLLEKQRNHIVMCDDMAFSTVFFSLSMHFVSTNMVQYYYYKRLDAYTSRTGNYEVYVSNLRNIKDVFSYMKYIQKTCRLTQYSECLEKWKNRYFRSWEQNINSSKLSYLEKKKLLSNNLIEALGKKNIDGEDEDKFFYQLSEKYYPFVEEYVKKISSDDISIISFDIFDTLLLRPLWEPDDLFVLMNDYLKQLLNPIMEPDFLSIRQYSEKIAREKVKRENNYDEVTLDEIYESMQEIYGYSKEVCDNIKNEEIRLELQMIHARQLGKYLFNLAQYLNKRIILISDMYLPENIVRSMLKKSGYTNFSKIYISSKYRLTKYNGDLFTYVLRKERISKRTIVHIGDNYHSDIDIPTQIGIQALHIPKISDVWLTPSNSPFISNFYFRCFNDSSKMLPNSSTMFLGSRIALSIAANNLCDNPFRNYKQGSDFNANPYDIGYSLLGPFFLGICHWLYDSLKKDQYDCIHFVARDGYLVKKAFDILQPYFGTYQIKTNYLRVSRKALIPLMIENTCDLDNLEIVLDYHKHSPRSILNMLGQIIDVNEVKKNNNKINGIILDKEFKSYDEYLKFIAILKEKFEKSKKVVWFREQMRTYFDSIIGTHDCLFDVGYSGRTESILGELLNKRIDTFYLNTTTQTGMDNARTNKFELNAFFKYLPLLSGPVRELLMSEHGPSCIGFDVSGNMVHPKLEPKSSTFAESYILNLLQRGAIDYINRISQLLNKELQKLSFREADLCWPLEYFLEHGSHSDLTVFNCVRFEDDLFLGGKQNIAEYWEKNQPISSSSFLHQYNEKGRIAKFITLFIYDRSHLKSVLRSKLDSHPIILNLSISTYRICRKIYKSIIYVTHKNTGL